jgi:hypothetical protein
MKKTISVVLEEMEIIKLMRILLDKDERDALRLFKKYFKGKARELLEGG